MEPKRAHKPFHYKANSTWSSARRPFGCRKTEHGAGLESTHINTAVRTRMGRANVVREASHGVSDEMRRTLIAAVHESVCGTFETWRSGLAMSVVQSRTEVTGRRSK
jgi:hypothetical protein